MLTLLTGKPGSGKTVYAVDLLLKINKGSVGEFRHIENIYNNISGFDFDKFQNTKVNFYKLEFKQLHLHIRLLHVIYTKNESKENLDDLLIEYCKEHKIFNSYFIIDECHNFFDSQDKDLMWWLTYHRHLHHEILFLTQNKTLINLKYRSIPEVFLDAQPRSKSIGKNTMRYFHFTDFAMSKKNKYDTTSITVNDEHFNVYKSGNTSKQKQVGKKYIYMFIAFLCVMVGVFYFLFSSILPDTNIEETQISKSKTPNGTNESNDELAAKTNYYDEFSHLKYMLLKCNTKRGFCLYKNQKINTNFYLKMKQLQDFQEISITPFMKDFVYLEVFVTDTFYSIYNKENDNEKNSTNNSTMFPTSSPSN